MESKYFPTWQYSKKYGAKLFANKEELEQAGDGWYDNPDKIGQVQEKEAEEVKQPELQEQPEQVEQTEQTEQAEPVEEQTVDEIDDSVRAYNRSILEGMNISSLRHTAANMGVKSVNKKGKEELIELIEKVH